MLHNPLAMASVIMTNKCAFCGKESVNFTKEHIYPKCLYKRTPQQNIAYLPQNDKIVESEVTVKDVCATCNNGVLSELDEYICKLFDDYFKSFIDRGEVINFEYSFELLARWLIKTSFNSSRANNSNSDFLAKCTDYVLFVKNQPNGLALFLQLVIPYTRSEDEIKHLASFNKPRSKNIYPDFTRGGGVGIQFDGKQFRTGRMVAINSYHFYFFICPDNVSEKMWKKFLLEIPRHIPGAIRLRKFKRSEKITASNVTTLEAYWDFVKLSRKTYTEWKSTRKNLRRSH